MVLILEHCFLAATRARRLHPTLSKRIQLCHQLLDFLCWLPFQLPNHFPLALSIAKSQVIYKLVFRPTVTPTGSEKLVEKLVET